MKKILVTGAGGYIGSILVPKLLSLGYKVIALDRFFFGKDKLPIHPNLKLIQDDSRFFDEKVLKNVNAIIDLVAISNDPSGELFKNSTYQINHKSRVTTATLAKQYGNIQYILPSSCSIYGFQKNCVDEKTPSNPLTVYSKANELAENDILALADDKFCVTVLRQATVYGYSPRMRFDLAVNAMAHNAYINKTLLLMRDGEQFRPMVHIQDTTDVMCLLLETDKQKINKQIFNVGDNEQCFKIGLLAKEIASRVGNLTSSNISIDWYGTPDERSYQVSFDKINKVLKWKAKWTIAHGVEEIINKLKEKSINYTTQTITLDWYIQLIQWDKTLSDIKMYDGLLDIEHKNT